MPDSNHYQTLGITPNASQKEIKQAYRRLAKTYHPDREEGSHEKIIAINAAYEVLSNPQRKAAYDGAYSETRSQRNHQAQQYYHRQRQKERQNDDYTSQWLTSVYHPIMEQVAAIINPLAFQIDHLAADPFDDQLLATFDGYLENCWSLVKQAKQRLRSQPNPSHFAQSAANLYHCLNQLEDGLEELAYFPLNFDEHHLHMGQELFRIANRLQAQATINA